MADTTTPNPQSSSAHRHRSNSRPGSRPTTPLRRPNSRSSIRQISEEAFPLNVLEPQFAELADTMVTLESNFQDLQTMHKSISRFNENFAAFLFGLNMNAFCIDFPEGPTAESFKRVEEKEAQLGPSGYPKPKSDYGDTETTFMTTDTSFVAEPPTVESTTPAPPSKTRQQSTMFLCKATLRASSKPVRFSLLSSRSISHPATASTPSTSPFAPRHFLSIADLTPKELSTLVRQAARAKHAIKAGNIPASLQGTLAGKTVALMFSKRSTRTRVSTEAAVVTMGGHPMFLGKDDIQLGVNESLYDTSKVISSMTSCIVARVGPHSDIAELAKTSSVPIINALSDAYHPLQAVTDILTISEAFPKLEGLKVAWVGDANNVLYDLLIACAKLGINVSVATPPEYPVDANILKISREAATSTGATIETFNEPDAAVKGANILVTDTWVSMGQESEKALRLKQFEGYQISMDLAERGGAHKDWKFMHCLPRKPEEVTDEVFYSPKSLVFTEAENRLYAALAALEAFVVKKGQFEE